jgi:hypothetical protein
LKQLPQLFDVAGEYDSNLKTLLSITFVPGMASLFGVFFLGFGNPAALLLFNFSMLAGLVNSMFPALVQQESAAQELPSGDGSPDPSQASASSPFAP